LKIAAMKKAAGETTGGLLRMGDTGFEPVNFIKD